MEKFRNILFQLMKHGTNTSHFAFIFLFSIYIRYKKTQKWNCAPMCMTLLLNRPPSLFPIREDFSGCTRPVLTYQCLCISVHSWPLESKNCYIANIYQVLSDKVVMKSKQKWKELSYSKLLGHREWRWKQASTVTPWIQEYRTTGVSRTWNYVFWISITRSKRQES
jgi:hypothetical protein